MPKDPNQDWWAELIKQAISFAGNDPAVLAEKIATIAHTRYNSESKSINPKNIRRWAEGERLFPLWARLSILRYCQESGWQPQSPDDFRLSYSLWARGHNDVTPDSFASDFNILDVGEILKFTKT